MSQSSVINLPESIGKTDNFEFYSCSHGREILNSENFSPDIMNYLEGESKTIQEVIINYLEDYHAMLEVGCGHARNVGVSLRLGLKYYGIDFIENEIVTARRKLKEKKLSGHVKCLSVLDLNKATTPVPASLKTVCIFPFNVFGNIFEPVRILKIMHDLNYTMLISTYRQDADKDAVLSYYKACGLNHVKAMTVENGTMFVTKEGFRSIVYHSDYLYDIASQLGLVVDSFEFSKIGKLYYIR